MEPELILQRLGGRAHDGLRLRAQQRRQVGQRLAGARARFDQRMLAGAGFPEAAGGGWSDAMVDAIVLWGDEARVAQRIDELFQWGAGEVLISPVGAGADEAESIHRTTRLIARLAGGTAS